MRRRFPLGMLVILALAVVALPAASASSSNSSSAHHGKRSEVIRVTEVSGQEADLDLGESGFSLGDEFVFGNDLFRHGQKVGTDGGVGTVVRLGSTGEATVQFVATAVLPKGQITVQGLTTFTEESESEPFKLAITGGTGRYRTAHGVLTVDEISETETLLTFRVIR